ncbi:MAG TPA: alpha-glucosidase/alpha-galactosidase [Armatimonadota bacterium]
MKKIVFIGAGSGFGAVTFTDIMSFPELHDSEVVLVDINPEHLEPVAAFARKVVDHYKAPTRVTTALGWRDGVLDGADYVVTAFAQGGPAYSGVPYHYEVSIPRNYGIYQNVADTVGIGGVFRTMRTAPELLAIAHDMEARCPGAYLLNYVNPMSMLTRTLALACPKIQTIGLCHNIQYGIRDIARWLGCASHKELRYLAAGINHMDWFLRLEYLDGRDAYPDLLRAGENPEIYRERPVQFELLKTLGAFTTESSGHCAEYLPYFMPRADARDAVGHPGQQTTAEVAQVYARWSADSPLMQQIDGRAPLPTTRSFEYGVHIMHALETDNVYRMNLNVQNRGEITNLPLGYNIEVPCTVDRTGVHPHYVGALPIPLAALCRGMADMQTLASDAILEKDINKARQACIIDPLTAASATPAQISACFAEVLQADQPWLTEYWGAAVGG